ncbi:MAG TPA: DNA polymerase III subunit delta [Clostridiales bacterium]|jgi:DNA polymerase-3 subunit delta|nr:DNA polymerase III subunit delta [Clostridiales bacterium]
MDYMTLFTQIQKGSLGKLYLLHGPEEFTKEEALSQIIEKLVPASYRDLNYLILDGTETTADDIIAASETLPFMADRRLVVVKNYSGLSSGKSDDEARLKKYLENIPDSTCLIFYQRGSADRKRMIYKAISKHGETVEFERLNHSNLVRWTRKRFQLHNKTISREDLEYFIMQTGNNLEDIKNEVEKLASFSGSAPDITRDAIDKLVTPSDEFTVFQFIDAVAARKKGEALRQVDFLLEQGQSVFGILSLIARQLKIMLLCSEYDQAGYSLDQIKAKLRQKPYDVHPYSVQKGMQQSRGFTMEQLRYGLNQCLMTDYGIKSGKIKDRLGLELLVIRMCRKERAS